MNESTEPAPEAAQQGSSGPWQDLKAFAALPRLGELICGPGDRLVVSVTDLDHEQTGYRSSWWLVDPAGERPARRYTRSVEGESAASFLSEGSLVFLSKRPTPPTGEESSAEQGVVWCLPGEAGEAYVLARRDGGWDGVATAQNSNQVLFRVDVHAGAADEQADAAQRALRKERKISAILHETYPIRSWDHDLGVQNTRLYAGELMPGPDFGLGSAGLRDLTGDVGRAVGESVVLADDGSFAVLDWQSVKSHGEVVTAVMEIDLGSGRRTVLAEDAEDDFSAPVISRDGRWVACVREVRSSAEQAVAQQLWLIDRSTGERRRLAEEWDAWPTPVGFSPDGNTVYAVADDQGHAPIFALDLATEIPRRLTDEGAFSSVQVSADGGRLFAVRSSYLDPGSVVAIATDTGELTVLPGPVDYPELPGTLEDIGVEVDGTPIRGYLLLPEAVSDQQPAPLVLWMHGGPLGSWNSWSWRWCPWLLVARGYAVLLPDPALSTGYGQAFVQRGWGRWGAEPYTDLMAITDAVERRPDIDADTTAAMGGSFGGYLANWVAGHTDRFRAIVSHAGLWNLESFGETTDAAWYWARELSPRMRHDYSPHRFAESIQTPMLLVHGDRDYRVPISEALSLWWTLVSRFSGPPEQLPHKFLYYPDENHWVLSPQHAIVWYETVLAFLEAHLKAGNFVRPETL